MLRHRRPGHVEPRRQLRYRDTATAQSIEDRAPCRVGNSVEDVDACASS